MKFNINRREGGYVGIKTSPFKDSKLLNLFLTLSKRIGFRTFIKRVTLLVPIFFNKILIQDEVVREARRLQDQEGACPFQDQQGWGTNFTIQL